MTQRLETTEQEKNQMLLITAQFFFLWKDADEGKKRAELPEEKGSRWLLTLANDNLELAQALAYFSFFFLLAIIHEGHL